MEVLGVPHHLLVSYDIADDERRQDISDLLAGYECWYPWHNTHREKAHTA